VAILVEILVRDPPLAASRTIKLTAFHFTSFAIDLSKWLHLYVYNADAGRLGLL